MALTDEELLQQLNVLASRTDQNANMAFKANAILNKGLNPDFFSGQSTKIVNALNDLAQQAAQAIDTANKAAAKINSMVIDIDDAEKVKEWEDLQELMGKATLVEGLKEVLLGRRLQLMLDLHEEDVGKVLSVARNDENGLVVKAVEMIAGGEGNVADLVAENVKYSNNVFSNFTNIKEAMDYVLANGAGSGAVTPELLWENIQNRPEVPNQLIIANNKLCLQSEEGTLSSVDLVNDMDIDTIVNEL